MPRFRSRRPASATTEIAVSEELFAPLTNGMELCYQTFGDPSDEPLLLVMGLGGPMTWWDAGLCRLLAQSGFYVIRYDNRDTGRSSRAQGRVTRPMLVRAFLGRRVEAPYRMADLAEDGFGLLDHLGIGSAHVTGVSMGGMIAQTMAIARPERVRSLVSIMSTTGRRTVGWQDPRLLPVLLAPKGEGLEAYVARRPTGAGSARPGCCGRCSRCSPSPTAPPR
jgi:pimeloyl-ACP methyl ester carboxylesterase